MAKAKNDNNNSNNGSKKVVIMDSGCAKGDKYRIQAEKKKTKFGWFGLTKQQNQEEAAELFIKAAVQYKISKLWDLAGLCYAEAAECNMASDNDIDAKSNWRESGKCYRHSNYKQAIESYKNAIQMNLENDRFVNIDYICRCIYDYIRYGITCNIIGIYVNWC